MRKQTSFYKKVRCAKKQWFLALLLMAGLCCSRMLAAQGWEHYFGGEGDQVGRSVIQTSDLGFMAVGYTETPNGQNRDVYLLKVDQNGEEQWSKTFGDEGFDEGHLIASTLDTTFVIIAYFENESPQGFYLLKINELGEEQWRQHLPNYGNATFLLNQQSNGSFYLAGTTVDSTNILTTKLTADGVIEWASETGDFDDMPVSMDISPDGKIILTGTARNAPGDPDNDEAFLMQLEADGQQDWYRSYGNNGRTDFGLLTHYQPDGTIWVGMSFESDTESSNRYFLVTDENGTQLSVTAESLPHSSFVKNPLLVQKSTNLYAYHLNHRIFQEVYLFLYNEEAVREEVHAYPVGFPQLDYNTFDLKILANNAGYLINQSWV